MTILELQADLRLLGVSDHLSEATLLYLAATSRLTLHQFSVGRTFSDLAAGIHITPIGRGATTPESLDVMVNLGSFIGNIAPTVSVSARKRTPVAIVLTATDAEGSPLTFSIVTLPTRGTLSGAAPNVTYSPTGGFSGSDTFTFKANDGTADSNVATVTISITRMAPVLASALSAAPNPALVGLAVEYSVAASDPDGDALTYAWDFGDGSSGTASQTAHVYVTAGTYQATVLVTNVDGLSVSSAVNVTVAPVGAGTDSDGDGVSDANEILEGTGPFEPTSFHAISMPVRKMAGKAKFNPTERDACKLAGIIPALPKLFDSTGKTMNININGASVALTLDSRGRGKSAQGVVSLRLKPVKRNPATRNLEFQGGT